jgi:5-methyltetrahydrofolate--homocysteine methyltransferase
MTFILKDLLKETPVITDGAWGTQLQEKGLPSGECPDHWNITHGDSVREVAQAYVEAGSRVILTNTFRGNRLALEKFGLAEQTFEINRQGARISREAAQGRALVFASIGPGGKMLVTGETTPKELQNAFTEQTDALAEGGADAIVIETMSDLNEALIALESARKTGLPVVSSMVYDSGKDKDRTIMGVTPEQAAKALSDAGADVIGANCGQGIEGFSSICRRLHASSDRPIWIKPNAGLPVLKEGKVIYNTTPDQFANAVPDIIAAGASFIGGCCGTDPAFIRAIRKQLS